MPVAKLDRLNTVLRMRVHKKRSVGRVGFDLGGGVKLAVSTYNFVQKAYKPTKMRLAKDTNEEVRSQRKFVHPDTGALLMPSEINKYQEYGGKKIEFSQDECKTITLLEGEVGLRLCGFKKRADALQWGHFVRSGYFIYPAEDLIKGSRQLFAALLQRCLARQMVAVCAYKARDSSGPSFVALLPQEEERDEEDGLQVAPPGFHLVFLPFADDLRSVPEVAFDEPEPEQVEAAKKLVNRIRMKRFHPNAFENPDLQAHYSLIEALALSKDDVDMPEDGTLPDVEKIDRDLNRDGTASDFLHAVYASGYDPAKPAAAGGKRKAAAAAPSKAKKARGDADEADDMAARVKAKTVEKLTVAELKAYLQSVKVDVAKMKKADLVAKVYEHCK